MDMEEILKLYINIGEVEDIQGSVHHVTFIPFTGRAVGNYFEGEILPGGVDTQRHYADGTTQLSARYVLKGKDHTGAGCRMFISNEMLLGRDTEYTSPTIITDSKALAWMEAETLYGKMDDEDGKFIIRILADCARFPDEKNL